MPAEVAAAEAGEDEEDEDKDAVVMLASKSQKTDDGSGREVTVQRTQMCTWSSGTYLGLHVMTGRSNGRKIRAM